MPDPNPPAPAPAHPWRKTARTALAGVITAALLLPLAIEAAGIDITAAGWRWLGGVLAVLAAVTRVLAVPQVNALLTRVGLGHDDVEAGQVLLLRSPEEDGRVVAGEASPIPTGQVVPGNVPVRVVDGGHVDLAVVLVSVASAVVVLALWVLFR